jgi:hypothetical protein
MHRESLGLVRSGTLLPQDLVPRPYGMALPGRQVLPLVLKQEGTLLYQEMAGKSQVSQKGSFLRHDNRKLYRSMRCKTLEQ